MIQRMLRAITAQYHLNGITTGEYGKMKVNGMNFEVWAFHAEGLGHVSAMTAKGFFGLMKMDTLMIVPEEKDLPLYSYDRILAAILFCKSHCHHILQSIVEDNSSQRFKRGTVLCGVDRVCVARGNEIVAGGVYVGIYCVVRALIEIEIITPLQEAFNIVFIKDYTKRTVAQRRH